ncbi:hypothetical protein FO519_009273 [Halicephalobus sp. NKZ332]|nr:hypothetical protein FO519_009273 [Halicephalobus sp. NKZ332]
MERRKPSRKQTSKKKSSYKNKKLDKNSGKKSENPCSTSKTDYTSIFGLTDHTMVKKFQRESYTPDTEDDESSSEEVNPIADDNEDQAFAEYQTPERLLEPDDNIILAHLRESAREKRGIIMEELDEDKKLKKQVESSSMESKKGKERKFDKNRSKNVDDVSEIPESPESPKDLETKLDAYLESGPNSVTSSIPSDSGKPRKKKVEEDESWKNYTVNQMIKASFIVTVEPAKNLKEGHICRLVMTKDCNGKPTENNRSPMTFTDYEFSSDSEPEENGYYFRKLYRHNPNLKQTKTKIEELKEQIAPEKFIKRIRHAITYDTKDEIGKWRKPIRKPFPSFYYPVKFVVPQGNPLTKLPKKEYNRIRGFRPRKEVNFMLRDEMMTYSGQVRRGAERLLNTFLQRELCTRNAMETFFILMLIKPKEFQNIQNTKNFSEKLKGMTSWVFKKGRLPFGFFDEILPKKFIPRQPMAACNYCPDAILAAVELVPSIVNIFQQDDVDVTARIERKRRSRAKKPPSESEFPDAMEDLRTLVEAEENVDPPVKAPEALVEEKPRKRGGKNMHNKKMKKPKMTEPELELMIESTSESKHLIETTEESEHLMDLVPESEYMMNSAEEPELSILGINHDFSPKLFSDIDIPVEEVAKARSTSFSPELGFKNEILTSTTKEVDKRSKKDTVEVVQVLEEVIPESHLEKVSKKLRLKNSEKSYVENEVSENSSEKRIPSSPDISLGEDIQQRLADEIVKDSTFSNELKLCPTSESIEKKKLPENIVVKDSESKVIKLVSKDSVKKSGDYTKEVDIQITQIPPDKEDVAVPGSSNNRIASSEKPAVKNNIQEASSERKSIIEKRLPSRIASVDPEEPVVKKRKLDPIVTLCDINEGLPPVSVGASEVVIPDENKSKTSVQVEIEEGEILDSDEEPEILFLGEKRPIQREKVQMNNLSKKIDTRRDHTKTKKDIGGRFDLQGELFDNHKDPEIPEDLSSREKAVFFNSPAIRGSYTIIFSVPSKPEVKVVEESPKSKNIQKKTEFEKIEKLISLNVEEKPKSSLKSESKIEQKLKPESVFLTPDISVPEKTSRSFPKDTVSPEHRSSDIETKKNRKGHPKSLDIQTLHESNKQKEKEKKVLSLVTSNSDLLLVLREGEKKEVLDYLTSLETGLTLETPSDIRPIPFEDLVKTSRNPSSRATDIKYYHNLKEDKDQSSSLQNLDFEEIYEPNRERVVAYCKPISRGSVPCQGVRAKKSKFIFIWEYSSIGWILTKRLQKEVTLSLEKPFDTGSRIMHDYGASLSFRRGENESYIVYKCSLGECLGTAGKLQSIDGYFTAYNGKMIFLLHPEKNETWKIDWLPCISLITFSLGGQKVKELTIESYSKVFGTEKSPIPLRVVDDPGKERSFFIHKPNDRYCRILDSGDPIEKEEQTHGHQYPRCGENNINP